MQCIKGHQVESLPRYSSPKQTRRLTWIRKLLVAPLDPQHCAGEADDSWRQGRGHLGSPPDVAMGSAFTVCCAAASPCPSGLGVHAPSDRLLPAARSRHTSTDRGGLGTSRDRPRWSCEFPGLPGSRCSRFGHRALRGPLSTSHAHGCVRLPSARASRLSGSRVFSVPQASQGGTRTSAHAGGRNRSLALPPDCAGHCCVSGLCGTESWVMGMLLPVVTFAAGNRCFRCPSLLCEGRRL